MWSYRSECGATGLNVRLISEYELMASNKET